MARVFIFAVSALLTLLLELSVFVFDFAVLFPDSIDVVVAQVGGADAAENS